MEDYSDLMFSFAVPADVEDEVMGVLHFSEEFRARYGSITPAFYQGSLEDALKESVHFPAKTVCLAGKQLVSQSCPFVLLIHNHTLQ